MSCSNANVDSCCSPKNGLVVLVQQWVQGFGPDDAFTLHGLWPDTCSGGQTGNNGCDSSRIYNTVGSIVQNGNPSLYNDMNTYWPSYNGDNNVFWSHEWSKHGTCVTTLNPACFGSAYKKYSEMYTYFQTALDLRSQYDLYQALSSAGITPGDSYDVDDMSNAISNAYGIVPKISCTRGTLNEIWLYFNVQGTSTYIGTDSQDSSCSGQIFFPNK
ncbi:RNase Sy [Spinellus fusiger]|nr:RNase Sy [Spinellus fusiger]